MLSAIRGWIRSVGEIVRFVSPIGGVNDDSRAEAIRSDVSRLRVHEAYQIGGTSERVSVLSASSTPYILPASSGKFLRILNTVDVWIRIDQPGAAEVAADPNTDNISVFFPTGETNFLVIPDTSQTARISTRGVTADGDLYVSVVQ